MSRKKLSHTSRDGRARMVDVSAKPETERFARAALNVRAFDVKALAREGLPRYVGLAMTTTLQLTPSSQGTYRYSDDSVI